MSDAMSGGSLKNLSHMIMLTENVTSKTFDYFLMYHETVMRSVRRYIETYYTKDRHNDVGSYKCATLKELYFGKDASECDIKCTWNNEKVEFALFDFTPDLEICHLDAFPSFRDSEKYVGKIIVTKVVNQKGFENAQILRSTCGMIVGLFEQNKFTMVRTKQDADEIVSAAIKSIEALVDWPVENVVILFRTNREPKNYRTVVEGHNVILLCRKSLVRYLGPTVASLLYSSESLSNLQPGETADGEEPADGEAPADGEEPADEEKPADEEEM